MVWGIANIGALEFGSRGLSATLAAHPYLTRNDLQGLPRAINYLVGRLHSYGPDERETFKQTLRAVEEGTRALQGSMADQPSQNVELDGLQREALLSLAFSLRELPSTLYREAAQATIVNLGLALATDTDNPGRAILLRHALSHPPLLGEPHRLWATWYAQLRGGSRGGAIALRTWHDWLLVAARSKEESIPSVEGWSRRYGLRKVEGLRKGANRLALLEGKAWRSAARDEIRLYGRRAEQEAPERLIPILEGAKDYLYRSDDLFRKMGKPQLRSGLRLQIDVVEVALQTLRDGAPPIHYSILMGW